METTFYFQDRKEPVIKNRFKLLHQGLMKLVRYKKKIYFICQIEIDWTNQKQKVYCNTIEKWFKE